jgi:hypothetical protein
MKKEFKAFPWGAQNHIDGMTLRDYFAAKAMPSVFEFTKNSIEEDGGTFEIGDFERKKQISTEAEVFAEFCYILADAMMEARK